MSACIGEWLYRQINMTIECHGYVESLTQSSARPNGVAITIRLEASRCDSCGGTIILHADGPEADFYRIGMPVILQLRPNVAVKAAT